MHVWPYSIVLFLALASLLRWSHRRGVTAHRLKRGLRTYIGDRNPDRGSILISLMWRSQYLDRAFGSRLQALIGIEQYSEAVRR